MTQLGIIIGLFVVFVVSFIVIAVTGYKEGEWDVFECAGFSLILSLLVVMVFVMIGGLGIMAYDLLTMP